MGVFDTLVGELGGRPHDAQVKLWDWPMMREYRPGDQVPANYPGPYSIRLHEGGWANISAGLVFEGMTADAFYPTRLSKWGGPEDEPSPVEEWLKGFFDEGWEELDLEPE